jgi:type I restriction enzyme S subunit
LSQNQNAVTFAYEYPDISELNSVGRIDAGFFSEDTKRALFSIQHYPGGCKPIDKLGFEIYRGQNLQVTTIGKSIYSSVPKKNFYRLTAPTDLSEFRTARRFRYLGNPRHLSVLKKGDVVFGAEGFEKGRTLIVVDDVTRTITNIHGIIFSHRSGDAELSTFVGCYLGYLRKIGLVDALAAGGSGGSLAINYFQHVPTPLFPTDKIRAVARMYTSGTITSDEQLTRENFLDWHRALNAKAGIWELDQSMKSLQDTLLGLQETIIEGDPVALPPWWGL